METAEEGGTIIYPGVGLSFLSFLGSQLTEFANSSGSTGFPSKGRPSLAYPAPLYGFCWKFGL